MTYVRVYFSPKCPQKLKDDCLRDAMKVCPDYEVVIGGDFNCDNDLSVLKELGFSRALSEPTNNFGSTIDHIYVKTEMGCSAGCNLEYYSDHKSVFLLFNDKKLDIDKSSNQIEGMTMNKPQTNTNCFSPLTENRIISPTLIKQTKFLTC